MLRVLGGLLAASLFTACPGGGGDKKPVGADIAGKTWSGSFYATDKPGRTAVTATITQDGDAVVIKTSKFAGSPAHLLTGTITADRRMRLTDGSDGEVWSTYFGPVTQTYIKLADFERPPVRGSPNDDFYVLELSRKGGERPSDVKSTAPNTTNDPPPKPTPTPPPPPPPPPEPPPSTNTTTTVTASP